MTENDKKMSENGKQMTKYVTVYDCEKYRHSGNGNVCCRINYTDEADFKEKHTKLKERQRLLNETYRDQNKMKKVITLL